MEKEQNTGKKFKQAKFQNTYLVHHGSNSKPQRQSCSCGGYSGVLQCSYCRSFK